MIGQLRRSLRTFFRIARQNPRDAFELIQLRLESLFGISLHRIDPLRRRTLAFELEHTEASTPDLVPYGNYSLVERLVPDEPVVFSLGVGEDVRFDLALIERHNASIHLFDPTPRSARYVENHGNLDRAKFNQIAIADFDGVLDVYIDDLQDSFESTTSVSVVSRNSAAPSLQVPCKTIRTTMREKGICHIDILKIDVEGAGVAILEGLLDAEVYPTQIAGEFERPPVASKLDSYFEKLRQIFERLRALGYTIYRTRPSEKGFQVEIVAARSGAERPVSK